MARRTMVLVLLAAGLWVGVAPARAQFLACAADRQKFCSDVPLGGGRVLACLRQHAGNLSAECRQAIGADAPPAAAGAPANASASDDTRAECRDDAIKFCRDAIGDKPKMQTCMREHAAELSDGCKTALIAHGQ